MKRLHVHLSVDDLVQSVRFYRRCSRPTRPLLSRITRYGCSMIRA